MSEEGYVDYFSVLDLEPGCKPGEVRKQYKKKMKDLLITVSRTVRDKGMDDAARDQYLLDMARLNSAFYILRDNQRRETYEADRKQVIALEQKWVEAVSSGDEAQAEQLRRQYDTAARHYLGTYMEEYMLEAGRDPECVEASKWDAAHERHASRVLRHYRQRLYQEIHERLPYYQITPPSIDWNERAGVVASILQKEPA